MSMKTPNTQGNKKQRLKELKRIKLALIEELQALSTIVTNDSVSGVVERVSFICAQQWLSAAINNIAYELKPPRPRTIPELEKARDHIELELQKRLDDFPPEISRPTLAQVDKELRELSSE